MFSERVVNSISIIGARRRSVFGFSISGGGRKLILDFPILEFFFFLVFEKFLYRFYKGLQKARSLEPQMGSIVPRRSF